MCRAWSDANAVHCSHKQEKGRGSEYGCVGGDGGAGVTAALFYRSAGALPWAPGLPEPPAGADGAHMVVCTAASPAVAAGAAAVTAEIAKAAVVTAAVL